MLASDVYRKDGAGLHVGRRRPPQGVWDRQPADCRRIHYAAYNDRQHDGPLRCHWGTRRRNTEGCSWNMSGRAPLQRASFLSCFTQMPENRPKCLIKAALERRLSTVQQLLRWSGMLLASCELQALTKRRFVDQSRRPLLPMQGECKFFIGVTFIPTNHFQVRRLTQASLRCNRSLARQRFQRAPDR